MRMKKVIRTKTLLKRKSAMNSHRLCVSLSATVALSQVMSFPVYADSIWQQMSAPSQVSTKRSKSAGLSSNSVSSGSHSLLLLSENNKSEPTDNATIPALTIHHALSLNPNETGLMVRSTRSDFSKVGGYYDRDFKKEPKLLAQLNPGNGTSGLTATPIPPVVSGALDMEEFKSTNVIDLKISQSRTFKSKNKIVRTSISDPTIAEPVVVAENQIVLLGKAPGIATMVLWDDAGNSVALDLRVTRDYSQLQSTLREIDPRIVAKTYSVGASDRVILLGDVDHAESIIRAFAAANVFMDDRGMNIQVANNRLITARIGEQGGAGGGGGAGGSSGLSSLGLADKYTYFPNLPNNITRAQLITSDGGRVTSLVKVRKVPLIVLHCTFLEMNTAAARALGVNLGIVLTTPWFSTGIGGNNNPSINVPISYPGYVANGYGSGSTGFRPAGFVYANQQGFPVIPSTTPGGAPTTVLTQNITGIGQGVALAQAPPSLLPTAALFGAPGGTTFSSAVGNLLNLFTSTANWNMGNGSMSVNPSIQGSIQNNRARILAEPTLVTVSGERASFLAGGEVPILQQLATAGSSQQSVTFEQFGLTLNMIPVLQENGTINLEISPQERVLSAANALVFVGSGTPIDSFTTRRTQTIVELKPGQELFISGLIASNNGRELDKTPILGEIPVLGALYRSKAFSKNESELVISVRPEIILPGAPGQLKLPEEVGRVEGPRDTNMFQVEPTVIDERHYTSGRAERQQKTSPTLPEGSPIPDNQ
jgi:Flp pilus assembly secretin CpaC